MADGLVSRRHALLQIEPDVVVVKDLGSRNGVAVNGVRIDGECPLQHMDRVYIGSQELVLIDADKMNERATTDRHTPCEVCGAINGVAKRYCGDCGARLKSDASATWKEPGRASRPGRSSQPGRSSWPGRHSQPGREARISSVEVPIADREWGGSENTHTARALDVLGSIASKAITMGRFDEAERILIPHLDALLERALRNRPLSDSKKDDPAAIFDAATKYALQLADGLHEKRWIDWVFRMHAATAQLMKAETIEALHDVVRKQEYNRRKYVRAYVQSVQNRAGDYGPSERFLVGRLDGLAQVILAR